MGSSPIFHCIQIVIRVFEYTCAYARWPHMPRFLSVCLSVRCHWTKIQDQALKRLKWPEPPPPSLKIKVEKTL